MKKPMERPTVVGRNLEWLKDRTGISYRQASDQVGMSESFVKHIVSGASKAPHHDNLEKLGAVYGVTGADLASPTLPLEFDHIVDRRSIGDGGAGNTTPEPSPGKSKKERFKTLLLAFWDTLELDEQEFALGELWRIAGPGRKMD